MKVVSIPLAVLLIFFSTVVKSQVQRDPNRIDGADRKFIALTFDDGPHDQATPALLDVLKKHNAKATFFVLGSRIVATAPILRRMVAEGHSIGNHTLTHAQLTNLEFDDARAEIENVTPLLRRITGTVPKVFRPPYGAVNDNVVTTARANGLAIILWSVNPNDSSYFSKATVISDRIVSSARDGDIVFMHDTSQRSVEAVEMTIRSLSEKGFVFVTVQELIELQGKLVAGKIYESAQDAN
jgi:peptidoglycan-N-acetylglucosamine deacetylase